MPSAHLSHTLASRCGFQCPAPDRRTHTCTDRPCTHRLSYLNPHMRRVFTCLLLVTLNAQPSRINLAKTSNSSCRLTMFLFADNKKRLYRKDRNACPWYNWRGLVQCGQEAGKAKPPIDLSPVLVLPISLLPTTTGSRKKHPQSPPDHSSNQPALFYQIGTLYDENFNRC